METSPSGSSSAGSWGVGRRQITEQGPRPVNDAPNLGSPRHPPGSYPGRVPSPEAPVSWQPRAAASKPGQVATVRFTAHDGPAPRPHHPRLLGAPTAPGGGRHGAGTACVPAQPGWGRGWRKQKPSRHPQQEGSRSWGDGCVDGDGGVWGCRLTLAVRPAQLLQAITAAPPSAPDSGSCGGGDAPRHLLCLTGSTCLAPLRNKTLMAASPGGC